MRLRRRDLDEDDADWLDRKSSCQDRTVVRYTTACLNGHPSCRRERVVSLEIVSSALGMRRAGTFGGI